MLRKSPNPCKYSRLQMSVYRNSCWLCKTFIFMADHEQAVLFKGRLILVSSAGWAHVWWFVPNMNLLVMLMWTFLSGGFCQASPSSSGNRSGSFSVSSRGKDFGFLQVPPKYSYSSTVLITFHVCYFILLLHIHTKNWSSYNPASHFQRIHKEKYYWPICWN